MNHLRLYLATLILLGFMLILSMGSGIWGSKTGFGQFTYELFSGVCHQIPDRTYHLNGQPMAVNSRCFGIFLGMFISWCLIPVYKNLNIKRSAAVTVLLFAAGLQIIDYIGNLMQLWENTNHSRAALGGFLGLVSFTVIADLFSTKNKN